MVPVHMCLQTGRYPTSVLTAGAHGQRTLAQDYHGSTLQHSLFCTSLTQPLYKWPVTDSEMPKNYENIFETDIHLYA